MLLFTEQMRSARGRERKKRKRENFWFSRRGAIYHSGKLSTAATNPIWAWMFGLNEWMNTLVFVFLLPRCDSISCQHFFSVCHDKLFMLLFKFQLTETVYVCVCALILCISLLFRLCQSMALVENQLSDGSNQNRKPWNQNRTSVVEAVAVAAAAAACWL